MKRYSCVFVTVDAVIFKKFGDELLLLLIQRKKEPFKDKWALPGGFVNEHEDLEVAVKRELLEETQLSITTINQLKAFGKPHRDPRGHMITIAFYGFANEEDQIQAGDDAALAQWFAIDNLPLLAFDHQEIINFALTKINR